MGMNEGQAAGTTREDINPLELEAQADEYEAEAFRLRAHAKRLRIGFASNPVNDDAHDAHLTRSEYARRSKVSVATVARWIGEGLPVLPVGSHDRIDPVEADAWRRARGKKPTTPKAREPGDDVDVTDVLSRGGLRALRGGR